MVQLLSSNTAISELPVIFTFHYGSITIGCKVYNSKKLYIYIPLWFNYYEDADDVQITDGDNLHSIMVQLLSQSSIFDF